MSRDSEIISDTSIDKTKDFKVAYQRLARKIVN